MRKTIVIFCQVTLLIQKLSYAGIYIIMQIIDIVDTGLTSINADNETSRENSV